MTKKKKRTRKQSSPFVIRLDGELLRLANAVMDLAEEAACMVITRSSVLRAAMGRGLGQMRDELLAKAKKS
jgi:hypothetical protein